MKSIVIFYSLILCWQSTANYAITPIQRSEDSRQMEQEVFSPMDPSSFSRPDLCVVTNISLDLQVDFHRRILQGNAVLSLKKVNKDVNNIILDVKDLLIFDIVEMASNNRLNFTVNRPVENFGSKLTVELPTQLNKRYVINVRYQTSPNASGLQWLTPDQTAGKVHPFLFSQFQPIHARSVLPCQDTPAVKTPYTATITAPKELTVLMSAKHANVNAKAAEQINATHYKYNFIQNVPVPSYLIAIAVGALKSRKLGPRSHIWAEKETIDQAAYEFSDTERQLKTAEKICGPYLWGIYDLLVLPPSFPYGGMENPCLTFVTPTLLAGDKSLANVVAHEIAHSWTGNLVTNKNFEHFWLNEGFTVFIERRIKAYMKSFKDQDFDAYRGVLTLQQTINRLGENNPLTSLVTNLEGVHPDDAFSKVPYEKGQIFLRYLENIVGGPEQFEPFLRTYFNHYKYKSIDTNDFKTFFESYFVNKNLTNIDWQTWLYKPGMPPIIPKYGNTLAEYCTTTIKQWNNGDLELTPYFFENFTTDQKIYVFQDILRLPPQSINKLMQTEHLLMLDQIQNSEIKFLWLRICIKAHWESKISTVLDWVNEIGRMKFVRPLYRDLYEWKLARPIAIENFKANRHKMMQVTARAVATDLHISLNEH